MLATILMWVFTIMIAIGLWLCYRTIKTKQYYKHDMEGPVLIGIGLVLSVITGMISGGEQATESFCALYGL